MYTVADENGEKVLSSGEESPVLDATDPFFDLIETLPGGCSIPIPLIKLGVLTQHIEPRDTDVDVDLRTVDIESAATAIVSSKTLAAVEYLLFHHTDHLSANEKKRVGEFCNASNLNRPNELGASKTEVIDAASNQDDENLEFFTRETTPQYVCESCGDVFNSESARSNHLEACPKYRSSTQSAENIATKLDAGNGGSQTTGEESSKSDTVECDYCGSTYASKSELTSHTIDCDDRPSNAYFECQYCQNKYVSKQGLNDHLENCKEKRREQSNRNNETREYECEHCGDVFDFAHKLTRHEYACSQGDSATQTKRATDELSNHEITGFVSHYNSEDGYGFISTSDLDADRGSDSGELTDVFFHVSAYPNRSPDKNDRVKFDIEKTDQGFKAINIAHNHTKPPGGWDNTFAGNRKQWGDSNRN